MARQVTTYLVCADSKFWIRSPEVTEEPWVKFSTSRRGNQVDGISRDGIRVLGDGIRVLGRVGNKKRME